MTGNVNIALISILHYINTQLLFTKENKDAGGSRVFLSCIRKVNPAVHIISTLYEQRQCCCLPFRYGGERHEHMNRIQNSYPFSGTRPSKSHLTWELFWRISLKLSDATIA